MSEQPTNRAERRRFLLGVAEKHLSMDFRLMHTSKQCKAAARVIVDRFLAHEKRTKVA